MRFVVDADTLSDAVRFCGRAITSRTSLAVYAGLYLEVTKGRLVVVGTDGQISCWAKLELEEGSEEGRAVLPATGFGAWLRALPAGEKLEAEATETGMKCRTANGYVCDLLTIGLTFPKPEWPQGKPYPVDLASLGAGLRRVVHATAAGEGMMGNILIRAGGKKMSVTATDSYRLARAGEIRGEGAFDVVIPANAGDLIAAAAEGGKGFVHFDGGHVIGFRSSDGRKAVLSRIIAGKFPTADHLIEAEAPHQLKLNREELTSTLGRVRPFSGGGDVLVLALKDDELAISARSEDVGTAAESIRLAQPTGAELVVGVGGRYFSEAVAAGGGEWVNIDLTAENAPILVYDPEEGAGRAGFVELVMPVRL